MCLCIGLLIVSEGQVHGQAQLFGSGESLPLQVGDLKLSILLTMGSGELDCSIACITQGRGTATLSLQMNCSKSFVSASMRERVICSRLFWTSNVVVPGRLHSFL